MENLFEGIIDTPKALPVCVSRSVKSVGLRRRTPRDSSFTLLSTSGTMAAPSRAMEQKAEPLAPKNVEAEQNNQDDALESDENSFLMTSTDWDLLDAETTKEANPISKLLSGMDDASVSSFTSAMLTPCEGLKPLEVENLNTLERCTLLPTDGTSLEYLSPVAQPAADKSASKSNTSLPKKLFDNPEEQSAEEELKKSPIITYKRRLPPSRRSRGDDKRLKPTSSPLKPLQSPLVSRLSVCSTPISEKSKLPLISQSPIVRPSPLAKIESDDEDDNSLLFELCDEIEKSVQNQTGSTSKAAATPPAVKKVEVNSIRAYGGFSTAGGTQIPLSEQSVKAAESLLAMFLAEDIPDD